MAALTLRSILAATDLSGASGEILRAAAALAALTRAELHVLHAFDLQDSPYAPGLDVATTFPGRIADAERALDDLIRRTVPPHVPVASRKVVIRTAFKAIPERARDVSADLIVLGPHRKRPVGDRLLGSTADRVIRTAEVPCLVVRGPLSLPLRRVVVPIDLSEHARGAMDVALAWGLSLGTREAPGVSSAEVDVVHVIPTVFDMRDGFFESAVIGPELDREIESALARTEGASRLEVREDVVWGDAPAEEIVRFAADRGADLVVLGTHGYGAVRRALVGSVASAVARRAAGPVLLVPPRLWREGEEGSEERAGGRAAEPVAT